MARAIVDLERDILALSVEDQQELLGMLITELDTPDEEVADLAREFVAAVERTDRSLQAIIDRLDAFDEEIERGANDVRKSVRSSTQRWPFALA